MWSCWGPLSRTNFLHHPHRHQQQRRQRHQHHPHHHLQSVVCDSLFPGVTGGAAISEIPGKWCFDDAHGTSQNTLYPHHIMIKPPTHPVATKWRSNEPISVEFRVFISELANIDKSFSDYHGKQGNWHQVSGGEKMSRKMSTKKTPPTLLFVPSPPINLTSS